MPAGFRTLISSAIAAALAALLPSQAQQAQPQDLNQVLMQIRQGYYYTELVDNCAWTSPLAVKAAFANLAINTADLRVKAGLAGGATIDAAIQDARSQGRAAPCEVSGATSPEYAQAKGFVDDQYWRMVAYLDVFDSYLWGKSMTRTEEEEKLIRAEVRRMIDTAGAPYSQLTASLEGVAQKGAPIVCRDRKSTPGKVCDPVPAELEQAAPIVLTIYDETEAFGTALAAETIAMREAKEAELGVDLTDFVSVVGGQCDKGALVLNMKESSLWTDTDPSFGMTTEIRFLEKFRLGQPARVGWVLLFRSYMPDYKTEEYTLLAEDGGDWPEENARVGAGDFSGIPQGQLDLWKSSGMSASEIEAQSREYADIYINNFVSMGLMGSINGQNQLTLTPCE